MASLREQQRCFAAALRDPQVACAVLPPRNLSIYRNNSAIAFRTALEQSFPVLLRRVGADYFRQLCALYRERHPSRRGDLHFAGQHLAEFLAGHLDEQYAWLADLARLEWAREQASVAAEAPPIGVDVLGRFASIDFERLVFELQPSLQVIASPYPVFSVWKANQSETAPPVDQSLGEEQGMVRMRSDSAEVRALDPPLHSFLAALAAGDTLGEAMSRAQLDEDGLREALRFVFAEGLAISARAR
jgi:hypothetical protein